MGGVRSKHAAQVPLAEDQHPVGGSTRTSLTTRPTITGRHPTDRHNVMR
jgi:hypothetical protein